jgi:hypothetical protein
VLAEVAAVLDKEAAAERRRAADARRMHMAGLSSAAESHHVSEMPNVFEHAALAQEEPGRVVHTADSLERERAAALRAIADEAREMRVITEDMNRMTAAQGEVLGTAEANVERALDTTVEGRKQLSQAAKYKLGAMVLTGAIVGAVVGGPVGVVAGAKSAAMIGAAVVAGGATGAMATKTVTDAASRRLMDIQDTRPLLTDDPRTDRSTRHLIDRPSDSDAPSPTSPK